MSSVYQDNNPYHTQFGPNNPFRSEPAAVRDGPPAWFKTDVKELGSTNIRQQVNQEPSSKQQGRKAPSLSLEPSEASSRDDNAPELYVAETAPNSAPEFNLARKAEEALLERYVLEEKNHVDTDDGAFGRSKEDGSRVLIKRVSKQSQTRAANIRREISILSQLSHPGLVEMHEWLESDLAIWLVVDHFPGATLGKYIASRGSLSASTIKKLFTQLLSGIGYLFLNRIAPLRICDQTLSLNANSDLIINDLSCAFEYCKEGEVQIDALLSGRYGDDIYVAPESYGNETYNARKAVIWSCGVVLYLIITGGTDRLSNLEHPVFQGASTQRRRFSVSSTVPNVLTYPNRLRVPEYARQVLSKMLEVNPSKRAEFIEVAARVPKQEGGEKLRPLIEVAWLDYKTHVGPRAGSLDLQLGESTYESSLYSTNTTTGLMGGRNRHMSTGW